jgi:hypothetical protein
MPRLYAEYNVLFEGNECTLKHWHPESDDLLKWLETRLSNELPAVGVLNFCLATSAGYYTRLPIPAEAYTNDRDRDDVLDKFRTLLSAI